MRKSETDLSVIALFMVEGGGSEINLSLDFVSKQRLRSGFLVGHAAFHSLTSTV